MLVTISFAAAISNTNVEKKESPLWILRTKRSISSKIGGLINNIKTKFIGDRLFFIPSNWLENIGHLYSNRQYCSKLETKYIRTCDGCTFCSGFGGVCIN